MMKLKLAAAAIMAVAAFAAPSVGYAQDAVAVSDIVPASLAEVPRNQTVQLGWGVSGGSSIGTTNPWVLPGYTHQEGNNLMWEPLMYFGIYKNEYIPWLADSMEYTDDTFTTLEIKLNAGAKWSDGTAVTAADVKYTFDGQIQYNTLPYHTQFSDLVDSVTAVDDLTVSVKFKAPCAALQVRSADAEVRYRYPDRSCRLPVGSDRPDQGSGPRRDPAFGSV